MERILIKKKFPIYGGKYLSRKAVHNWDKKFSQECSKAGDDAHPCRPVEVATEETAAGRRVDSS
jgi:hypothetical protein